MCHMLLTLRWLIYLGFMIFYFLIVPDAKKEIDKQLGGSTDNLNLYKPSNNARQRRAGILGYI